MTYAQKCHRLRTLMQERISQKPGGTRWATMLHTNGAFSWAFDPKEGQTCRMWGLLSPGAHPTPGARILGGLGWVSAGSLPMPSGGRATWPTKSRNNLNSPSHCIPMFMGAVPCVLLPLVGLWNYLLCPPPLGSCTSCFFFTPSLGRAAAETQAAGWQLRGISLYPLIIKDKKTTAVELLSGTSC